MENKTLYNFYLNLSNTYSYMACYFCLTEGMLLNK